MTLNKRRGGVNAAQPRPNGRAVKVQDFYIDPHRYVSVSLITMSFLWEGFDDSDDKC